jgi:hypothetical protein
MVRSYDYIAPAWAALFLLSAPSVGSAACLKANTDGQVAQGQLTVQTAKDMAGRTERPYILQLSASACLEGTDADDNVKSTRTIHVFPADQKLEPAFKRFVGKAVVVTGSPFPEHTAHHHAPIVMGVTEIKPR